MTNQQQKQRRQARRFKQAQRWNVIPSYSGARTPFNTPRPAESRRPAYIPDDIQ